MSMGKVARRRGINVIRAVAEALPIRGELFEIVLMITVICFVDGIETALKEGARVFKSGGYIVIGYVMAISASSFIYIAIADLIPSLHRYATIKHSMLPLALILGGIGTIAIFHLGH